MKKAFRRFLLRLVFPVLPTIYMLYMWLVYRTSKVEELGMTPDLLRKRCGGGVFALWHDEVAFVAYAFSKYRPHTLASRSDQGEMITTFLRRCGFQVFRGGSSHSRRRRETGVLATLTECMRAVPGVLLGITCDGSQGPVYRMKRGPAKVSIDSGCVLALERTWCKRYLRLPTWDQTIIPMPFNHIVHAYQGPFYPPEPAAGPAAEEEFRAQMEGALCRLSGWTRRYVEGRPPPRAWVERHPPEHRAAVAAAGELELLLPIAEELR